MMTDTFLQQAPLCVLRHAIGLYKETLSYIALSLSLSPSIYRTPFDNTFRPKTHTQDRARTPPATQDGRFCGCNSQRH